MGFTGPLQANPGGLRNCLRFADRHIGAYAEVIEAKRYDLRKALGEIRGLNGDCWVILEPA